MTKIAFLSTYKCNTTENVKYILRLTVHKSAVLFGLGRQSRCHWNT